MSRRRQNRGEVELYRCLENNDPVRLRELIIEGINVNHMFGNPGGIMMPYFAALHVCCQKGLMDCLKVLVETASESLVISVRDRWGQTPLMYATSGQWHDILEYLLQNGANPNSLDDKRRSCLLRALANNDIASVQILLDFGADANIDGPSGETPLQHLIKGQLNLEMMEKLLLHNADIDKTDPASRTPLHFALMRNQLDYVRALLIAGASTSVVHIEDHTPLMSGVFNPKRSEDEKMNMVNLFLECGASLDDQNKSGRTILHLIALSPKPDLILLEYLLTKGADPNLQDINSCTALLLSISKGKSDVTYKLLEHNANLLLNGKVDVFDLGLQDFSPLKLAVYLSNIELFTVLSNMCSVEYFHSTFNDLESMAYMLVDCPELFSEICRIVFEEPSSLKSLCWRNIRHTLGVPFKRKVKSLELPIYLENFLQLTGRNDLSD